MYRKVITHIFVLLGAIFIVLGQGVAYGQTTPSDTSKPDKGGDSFFSKENPRGKDGRPDSLDKKKKKPLESYFFEDTLQWRDNWLWNVSLSKNKVEVGEIDTALYMNQVDYEFLTQDVGDAFLGNLGGATYPLNYTRRPSATDEFSLANAYKSYFKTPETADFYNTKKIFTIFEYLSAGQTSKREENFSITHAQNVTPSIGFNLDYQSRGTRGIYTWQVARAKTLSAAASHTGKKYSVHAGYIYNAINAKENGGLQNDTDITDTVFEITANIPVNLEDARNIIKNNTYYIVQSYGVPLGGRLSSSIDVAKKTTMYFGHSMEYSRMYRKYTDTQDGVNNDFYENWYIDPTETCDSTFESKLSNKLFVQLQPWSRNGAVGLLDIGAGVDVNHFYQFSLDQFQTGDTDGFNKTSFYVYGAIEGNIKKILKWDADIKYHPAGYKSQDLDFGARMQFNPKILGHTFSLKAEFTQTLSSPDYWSENYFSNHFMWSNSFNKESETRISASLKCPTLGIDIGLDQSVVTNKIYYNNESLPSQCSDAVSVSGIYLNKDFHISGLHFNHRVLLQWSSSQEVVPVPLVSAFLSYYYELSVVKDVLRIQFGIDCRYTTEYYAKGYNPATAQFYNQTETLVGNYPTVDVFVNAKWKRMRILVKYSHLNESLFDARNYFSVAHYPQNERVLKFGISWGFYD